MGAFTIYVAGAYAERDRVVKWMDAIREHTAGHIEIHMVLARDWVAVIDQVRVTGGFAESDVPTEEAQDHAWDDLAALRRSDLVWFLAPKRGGRGSWFEAGVAFAWRIPLFVSGPWAKSSIFTRLGNGVFDTDEAAWKKIQLLARGNALEEERR